MTKQSCYLTVYSGRMSVVGELVDAYLDVNRGFDLLHNSLRTGEHQLYVSNDLKTATNRLMTLLRENKVAKVEGSACHLFANISSDQLQQKISAGEDFRQYLSELKVGDTA